jgi:hypothetical protein
MLAVATLNAGLGEHKREPKRGDFVLRASRPQAEVQSLNSVKADLSPAKNSRIFTEDYW